MNGVPCGRGRSSGGVWTDVGAEGVEGVPPGIMRGGASVCELTASMRRRGRGGNRAATLVSGAACAR